MELTKIIMKKEINEDDKLELKLIYEDIEYLRGNKELLNYLNSWFNLVAIMK